MAFRRDMSTTQKVLVEVLDRRIKDGWFSRKYFVTLRILENGWCVADNSTVCEYQVNAQNYWDMIPGTKGHLTLYKHSNGLWGRQPEQAGHL